MKKNMNEKEIRYLGVAPLKTEFQKIPGESMGDYMKRYEKYVKEFKKKKNIESLPDV